MKIPRFIGAAEVKLSNYYVPPALYCAYNGHTTVMPTVLSLTTAGDNARASQLDYSALRFAVVGKRTKMITWLLDHNANIEIVDVFDRTPLHLAAGRRDIHVLLTLLRRGAMVLAQDDEGFTPSDRAKQVAIHDHTCILDYYQKNFAAPERIVQSCIESVESHRPIMLDEKLATREKSDPDRIKGQPKHS